MANKKLFSNASTTGKLPETNAVNDAGGAAYAFSDEHALAQYATTGCLNGTYYASAETQLDRVQALARKVTPKFLAQVAVYSRETGLMKDVPALLLAILSTRDIELTKKAFPRVCNDAKMVKNFVQIIRSGTVGRKSLGSALKRCIQNWLASRTEEQLFNAVVGNDPSLADIVKMVHPRGKTVARSNFYRYLIGKELTAAQRKTLPANVRAYEKFKAGGGVGEAVPEVPFQLLANLKLSKEQYQQVAANMSWSALRQNLNQLAKHGIFETSLVGKLAKKVGVVQGGFDEVVAAKLSDPEQVRAAKAFPFQLYSAWQATASNLAVPESVRNALQDAMETSLANVPEIAGKLIVAVDNSGSMSSNVTGDRGSATSKVTCLDAAALMGSALLRRNPNSTKMMAFNTVVVGENFNGRDSVVTNADKLRRLLGGGTDCSVVLRDMNRLGVKGIKAVIYLSDNESWVDTRDSGSRSAYGRGTSMLQEWNTFRTRNPDAKLVCIDIQPNKTGQVVDRPDIMNIGGFSDSIFTVISLFLSNDLTPEHWVGKIKETVKV